MKILFGITLLAIGAAAFLAYSTRSKLIEMRAERDNVNKSILVIQDNVRTKNAETTKNWESWAFNQKSSKDQDIARKGLERDIETEKDNLKKLNDRMEEIKLERATMQKKIDDAVGAAGGDLDQLTEKVTGLEGETDALAQEVASLTKEMEVAKAAAGQSDAESARRRGVQLAREKTISLTGRSATVLEVNTEFSFVLLSVGRSDGLTTDSKLMVKRNGVHIANLKIVALENNRTVADIELKTARAGYQVMPGDRVVIETSVQ